MESSRRHPSRRHPEVPLVIREPTDVAPARRSSRLTREKSRKKHGKDIAEESPDRDERLALRDEAEFDDQTMDDAAQLERCISRRKERRREAKRQSRSKAKETRAPRPKEKIFGKKMIAGVNYEEYISYVSIVPPVMMCSETLEVLGIRGDVDWYIEAIHLTRFFALQFPAYEDIIREFLSTVTLSYPDVTEPRAGDGVLRFTIDEEPYEITIDALCDLFDFPKWDSIRIPRKNELYHHWQSFAREDFHGGQNKASRITHPAVRYVSRLLAHTMFSRKESGTLLRDEFYILIGAFVADVPEANYGSVLASRLVQVKHDAFNSGRRSGAVATGFGSIISVIVESLGVDLSSKRPMSGTNLLDLSSLIHMHFLCGWDPVARRFGYEYTIAAPVVRTVLLPADDIPPLRDGLPLYTPTRFRPASAPRLLPIYAYTRGDATSEPVHEPRRHSSYHGETGEGSTSELAQVQDSLRRQGRLTRILARAIRRIAPQFCRPSQRPQPAFRLPSEDSGLSFSFTSDLYRGTVEPGAEASSQRPSTSGDDVALDSYQTGDTLSPTF